MSLQVWLPLNGNLNNQGLWNTTFSNSNTTNITATSGKVTTSCYQRASKQNSGLIKSSGTINLNNDFSMCCWAYVTDTVGDTANGLVSNHSHADNTGCGITVKQVSASDYRISCNTGDGTNRTYCSYYGKTNIKNRWCHLTLTYSKSAKVLRLFVDGVEEYKLSNYTNASKSDYILLFDWSTSYGSDSYKPACKLNDVRIYDHCLSDKEIHELAKGLCLHYKLSRSCTNLVRYDSSVTIADSGTVSLVSGEYPYAYSFKATGGNKRFYIQTTNVWKAGVTYTYSFFAKADSSVIVQPSRSLADFGGLHSLSTNWVKYSGVIKSTATVDGGTLSITTDNTSSTVTIALVKLEEGEHVTPWIPNPSDSMYAALGYNSTEPDCSGYGNDGTIKSTVTYSNDTPRYIGSIFIPSGGVLGSRKYPDNVESLTLSAWIKASNPTSQNIVGNWESGGCGIYTNSAKKAAFQYYDGSAYQTAVGTTVLSGDVWYFITGVFSYVDKKAYIYVNGVLETQITVSTYIRIGGATNVPMSIGNPNATSVSGITNAYISDARVYATALSPEDILALYNAPTSIDSNGNMYCSEFVEV